MFNSFLCGNEVLWAVVAIGMATNECPITLNRMNIVLLKNDLEPVCRKRSGEQAGCINPDKYVWFDWILIFIGIYIKELLCMIDFRTLNTLNKIKYLWRHKRKGWIIMKNLK